MADEDLRNIRTKFNRPYTDDERALFARYGTGYRIGEPYRKAAAERAAEIAAAKAILLSAHRLRTIGVRPR
jgi:hypothetical protein